MSRRGPLSPSRQMWFFRWHGWGTPAKLEENASTTLRVSFLLREENGWMHDDVCRRWIIWLAKYINVDLGSWTHRTQLRK